MPCLVLDTSGLVTGCFRVAPIHELSWMLRTIADVPLRPLKINDLLTNLLVHVSAPLDLHTETNIVHFKTSFCL